MLATSILIYLVIALATALYYFTKKNHRYWLQQGIPHEKPHLLSGSLHGLRTTRPIGLILSDYYLKFKGTGPFAGFYMIQRPAVVLLDIPTIKNVLIKDFNNFTDRGLYYNEKNDPLTGHLFLLDGQKWRTMRNKLSPCFSTGKMKQMFPNVLQVADEFMLLLSELASKSEALKMRDLLACFTTDIIGSAAFGINCNSLTSPNPLFMTLVRKAFEVQRHNAAIMGFIDGYPKLARKLGMRILTTDVHEFFMKTISEMVEYRERNNIKRNDLLNVLLEMKNNADDKTGLAGISISQICAQVFVFFLGGSETSSSTMLYSLFELAQHQKVQDRLRAEVHGVFEQHKAEGLSYEALGSMTYLEQVISESLRKYSPVPMLNRQALNDYTVPGHPQYVIKKGMPVIIPVHGLHHDPELYPNPEIFDPERFSPDMLKQRDPVQWLAFGDGPRNCVGMRFGKMQTRLGLACIVNRFRISLSPETNVNLEFDPKSPNLIVKHKLYFKLESIGVE